MKRRSVVRKISSVVVAVSIAFYAAQALAQKGDLSALTKEKKPIKVFLQEITYDSGQDPALLAEFRKSLESALRNRKSVSFEIVDNPASSDVRISSSIKNYQYMEKGPMKISPSPSGILLDMAATATENYAEMAVEYTITDARSNNTLWKDTVSAYEKKIMTPQESASIVCDKVSRAFLWKSFGKPK